MSLEANDLSSLFELSHDAVVGVQDRRVVFLNPAARALFGAQPECDAAKLIPDFLLDDPAKRFLSSAVIGGQSLDVSVTRSGELSLFCFAHRSEAAPPPAYAKALGELGSNLLTARLAMDRIIQGTDAERDEKLRSYAAILYQTYFKLKRLHGHLTLSGGLQDGSQPFRPRLIALDELCGSLCDTVDVLARSMDVGVRFECAEEDCCVLADPGLLETMLLNLLTNSLLRCAAGDTIRVTLAGQGRRLVISVDDSGAGIPAERLSHLYAPGEDVDRTDAAAGAGLGLVIARGVAEKHGGALILESREGVGTCLRVLLPRPAPSDTQSLRQPESPYRTDGMNAVLTELSVVLDKSFYNQKTFD